MDLDLIKKKLETLSAPAKKSTGDGKKNFWKPSVGKETIRIVPSAFNKDMPFNEMRMYYGIGVKVLASPSNFGEKDPIIEFAKQLRLTSTAENEQWKLAKKLDPKTRISIPVIVRGEEDKGVRLWEFGPMVYQEFLNMAVDDEIGDFTDVVEGRDIKLTTVGPEVTGTAYNKTTVTASMKITPLSTKKKEVELWLKEQPEPKTIPKRYSYDEIKGFLAEWLNSDDDEDEVPQKSNETSYSPKDKESKSEKFDNLFDEKEDK